MRFLLTLLVLAVCGAALADEPSFGSCLEDDAFEVFATTNHLRIVHRQATYNCCPDPVSFMVEREGQQIHVTERVLPEFPCDCICCFEFEVELDDVPGGFVFITYSWLDVDQGGIRSIPLEAWVPGGDATEEIVVAASQRSDCLPTPNGDAAWGAVKAAYR